jgi:hypothetical protein
VIGTLTLRVFAFIVTVDGTDAMAALLELKFTARSEVSAPARDR